MILYTQFYYADKSPLKRQDVKLSCIQSAEINNGIFRFLIKRNEKLLQEMHKLKNFWYSSRRFLRKNWKHIGKGKEGGCNFNWNDIIGETLIYSGIFALEKWKEKQKLRKQKCLASEDQTKETESD